MSAPPLPAPNGPARRGFTYVDLVVTVLLIGVLAGITTPKFADSLTRHRGRAAALRVQADLKAARHRAISQSAPIRVQFSLRSGTYRLGDATWSPGDPRWTSVDLSAAPYHVILADVALGPDNEVLFDIHGQPDRGGTVTVRTGSVTLSVTIDPETGEVTVP